MKNIQNISLQPFQAVNYQLATDEFWSVEDVKWMHEALNLAKQGAEHGEVPVGAILVHNQQIIGQGFNEPIGRHDATAHAEIVALRDACRRLNNYRLPLQTTLYVTLEPCTMCIGALIHARVDRLIYAASEPRAGMVGSQMLKDFFRQRRQASKQNKR